MLVPFHAVPYRISFAATPSDPSGDAFKTPRRVIVVPSVGLAREILRWAIAVAILFHAELIILQTLERAPYWGALAATPGLQGIAAGEWADGAHRTNHDASGLLEHAL